MAVRKYIPAVAQQFFLVIKIIALLLSLRARVFHPSTRVEAGLLGPCFKTGRMKPFRPY